RPRQISSQPSSCINYDSSNSTPSSSNSSLKSSTFSIASISSSCFCCTRSWYSISCSSSSKFSGISNASYIPSIDLLTISNDDSYYSTALSSSGFSTLSKDSSILFKASNISSLLSSNSSFEICCISNSCSKFWTSATVSSVPLSSNTSLISLCTSTTSCTSLPEHASNTSINANPVNNIPNFFICNPFSLSTFINFLQTQKPESSPFNEQSILLFKE